MILNDVGAICDDAIWMATTTFNIVNGMSQACICKYKLVQNMIGLNDLKICTNAHDNKAEITPTTHSTHLFNI